MFSLAVSGLSGCALGLRAPRTPSREGPRRPRGAPCARSGRVGRRDRPRRQACSPRGERGDAPRRTKTNAVTTSGTPVRSCAPSCEPVESRSARFFGLSTVALVRAGAPRPAIPAILSKTAGTFSLSRCRTFRAASSSSSSPRTTKIDLRPGRPCPAAGGPGTGRRDRRVGPPRRPRPVARAAAVRTDPADPAREPALDLPGVVDPHAQRGTEGPNSFRWPKRSRRPSPRSACSPPVGW